VIGGLAVNAYVEPVVSLEVDTVLAVHNIDCVLEAARTHVFKVEEFEHRIKIAGLASDLRIQLQTDPRYQPFLAGATVRGIYAYAMKVAALEDVLQGKVWAYSDQNRRRSKRQKDLADILRIIEAFPDLTAKLPEGLKAQLQE
jgi:hypothetical protein